jgi:hypothetical protein
MPAVVLNVSAERSSDNLNPEAPPPPGPPSPPPPLQPDNKPPSSTRTAIRNTIIVLTARDCALPYCRFFLLRSVKIARLLLIRRNIDKQSRCESVDFLVCA